MRIKRPHLSVVKLLKNKVLLAPLTYSPHHCNPNRCLTHHTLESLRFAAFVCQQQRNEIMKDFFVTVKSISLFFEKAIKRTSNCQARYYSTNA